MRTLDESKYVPRLPSETSSSSALGTQMVTDVHGYRTRWGETLKQSSSFADLQRAVKFNGTDSPCVAGCRSVCWKVSYSSRATFDSGILLTTG